MRKILFYLVIVALVVSGRLFGAETITLQQSLQRVIDTYPSLRVAELQLRRARQENARVESQLGWTLAGSGGRSRDTALGGAASYRTDIAASLQRRLSSGASVGLDAGYSREDVSETFIPGIPDPTDVTDVGLSWRQPLAKGFGNPAYKQGLVSAEAEVNIAEAGRRVLHDSLARQVADLYYSAALTQANIKNAAQALDRARRLKKYLQDNAGLGIAEEKDLLQAEAQLRTRVAERRSLKVAWEQQRTNLNRLMGRAWDAEFNPAPAASRVPLAGNFDAMFEQVENHNPDLMRSRAQLMIADAAIALNRDAHKDDLDVVFSVGNRTTTGDLPSGNLDESERIAGVRLEYSRALDQRGLDAELYQAQLDRDIASQEIKTLRHDLRYTLSSLLAEIEASRAALDSFRARLVSEQRKFEEAVQRYRTGRTTTEDLIRFESDLFLAEITVEQQAIALARRHTELDVLRGTIWKSITPLNPDIPAYSGPQRGKR